MPIYCIKTEVEEPPKCDMISDEFQQSPWGALMRSLYTEGELSPGIRVVEVNTRPGENANHEIAAWLRKQADLLEQTPT